MCCINVCSCIYSNNLWGLCMRCKIFMAFLMGEWIFVLCRETAVSAFPNFLFICDTSEKYSSGISLSLPCEWRNRISILFAGKPLTWLKIHLLINSNRVIRKYFIICWVKCHCLATIMRFTTFCLLSDLIFHKIIHELRDKFYLSFVVYYLNRIRFVPIELN